MTTVYIVGKGPSLLNLRPEHFDDNGPVITLNHAILNVRRVGVRNHVFAMQKDGCVYHGPQPGYVPPGPDHDCGPEVIRLEPPETLIVSKAESLYCLPGYDRRLVVDPEGDFGIPWYTPSAPVATKLAISWGAKRIVFVSHDAFTHGDYSTVYDDLLIRSTDLGYRQAGELSDQFVREAGVEAVWLTP